MSQVFLHQKQCHELKILPEFYDLVASEAKRFEIRKDDRGFMAGDFLWLREWNPDSKVYTGRSLVKQVGYVMTWMMFHGLSDGYSALSLDDVSEAYHQAVRKAFEEAK